MTRDFFEHHTSRTIAIYRLGLAVLFGAWVWLDPGQPARGGTAAYIPFASYVLFSIVILPLAWRNWWLDYRLGLPVLLVDSTAFVGGIYFTETTTANFFTPFLTFMAFILISTRLRWGRHAAVITAVCISAGYLLAGQFLDTLSSILFLRRFSYMVVLALLFTTFALHRAQPKWVRFSVEPTGLGASPQEQALAYAMELSGATGGLLAWAADEEPRLNIHRAGTLGFSGGSLAPGDYDLAETSSPFLFDAPRRRVLVLEPGDRLRSIPGKQPPGLVLLSGAEQGLSVPLNGTTGRGQLILTGISGMSQDDLRRGDVLGQEISRALDDEELDFVAREMVLARSRATLARDLHDSVAQSLAGANFRLQALRAKLEPGSAAAADVEAIMAGMKDEQRHVRDIIEGLRRSELEPGTRNLVTELVALVETLGGRWGVQIRLERPGPSLIVPTWLSFEVQQLVREAVANAARHAKAENITVSFDSPDAHLRLSIANDRIAEGPETFQPRSLTERVNALGGTLKLMTQSTETRIEITLPLRGKT